jgi:hypothetical protein
MKFSEFIKENDSVETFGDLLKGDSALLKALKEYAIKDKWLGSAYKTMLALKPYLRLEDAPIYDLYTEFYKHENAAIVFQPSWGFGYEDGKKFLKVHNTMLRTIGDTIRVFHYDRDVMDDMRNTNIDGKWVIYL